MTQGELYELPDHYFSTVAYPSETILSANRGLERSPLSKARYLLCSYIDVLLWDFYADVESLVREHFDQSAVALERTGDLPREDSYVSDDLEKWAEELRGKLLSLELHRPRFEVSDREDLLFHLDELIAHARLERERRHELSALIQDHFRASVFLPLENRGRKLRTEGQWDDLKKIPELYSRAAKARDGLCRRDGTATVDSYLELVRQLREEPGYDDETVLSQEEDDIVKNAPSDEELLVRLLWSEHTAAKS